MIERIAIVGAGESGTGAAILAKAKGYDVFVSDQGQIKDKYKAELTAAGIPFEEGTHTEDQILLASLVIKSPGIPDKAEIVKKIKGAGISIIDEIEFACRYIDGKIIGITGTNGKTTTTLLTYHLLKSAGHKVALAGNVGFSLARQVTTEKFEWYVLEMSSYQLDGTCDFSPAIGVLLNITPDHLDRYEYTMQKYVDSKFQLIQNMKTPNHFIYYTDDVVISTELKKREIAPKQVAVSLQRDKAAPAYYDGSVMRFDLGEHFSIAQEDTTLKGPHNLINTMAAVSAAYLAGVSVAAIRAGLKTFKNAPHRLEPVATIKGVDFVNDSKATNVDSVVYALGSYDKPLVWIAGGVDKGNDYGQIEDAVRQKVRALICLGKDNEKLKKAFGDVVPVVRETQSVPELVKMALQEAKPGDVVLLSPACASFDLFRNYEDRGDQFRKAVLDLKKEVEG
ncbi:UDP-N-acetylmuramoyl-L-alanine--D-glutamate ligase [Fulvivirgaceae bacterium PWU5]|uniref:UDP-N-acetylmuramoylalanine--D-glutamate ligase n=1 Tax=Dawidia cretensis TaxID=2782350 RepID=A0AAP2GP74_9BACT|nr:UDP-N-acetylmuramoyl-L-alanine--D-glutamate ligase [Dawidia cretensis]MBT1708326.1 UDP-N-acetylmuramoyl-L-alanine--D-glutamate ligase [Dawidia cretensis]